MKSALSKHVLAGAIYTAVIPFVLIFVPVLGFFVVVPLYMAPAAMAERVLGMSEQTLFVHSFFHSPFESSVGVSISIVFWIIVGAAIGICLYKTNKRFELGLKRIYLALFVVALSIQMIVALLFTVIRIRF